MGSFAVLMLGLLLSPTSGNRRQSVQTVDLHNCQWMNMRCKRSFQIELTYISIVSLKGFTLEEQTMIRHVGHVARVWDTYRTLRLRLIDLISRCCQHLNSEATLFRESEEYSALQKAAQDISGDICASVAYQLYGDQIPLAKDASLSNIKSDLGGLFLMWPLFSGAILSIVPQRHRAWMRNKLRAIGTELGLAQAIALANTCEAPNCDDYRLEIVAQGHTFLWSGCMF